MVGISSQLIGVGEFEITTQRTKNCTMSNNFYWRILLNNISCLRTTCHNLPRGYWPSVLVSPASQLTVKGSSGSHVTFLLERTTSK